LLQICLVMNEFEIRTKARSLLLPVKTTAQRLVYLNTDNKFHLIIN